MANWIKVEKATARKPEVLRIADILGIHPDHAFGLCVRFWCWCDDNMTSQKCHAPSVTFVTLDTAFGHAGFCQALVEVRWLIVENGVLSIPHFDRHLGESAKTRDLSAERKRKQRKNSHENSVTNVTEMSRSDRDKSVTRGEERRGDKDKDEETKDGKPVDGRRAQHRFVPPSLDEVREYCNQRGSKIDPEAFMAHYESNGWKIGKVGMSRWKSAIVTWEKTEAKKSAPPVQRKARYVSSEEMNAMHARGEI